MFLEVLLKQLDMSFNPKGRIIPMLESIKNSFLGKVHYPHSHFIDYGIHSITLRMYNDLATTSKKETLA